MAPTIQELGLDRLSPEDRLTVAEAIWESVAREMDAAPLPATHAKGNFLPQLLLPKSLG